MMNKTKIAVIGGGAAGIFAALGAFGAAEVTIYEKNDRIGKKLLATGNGRCNLTNINAAAENYHGADVGFIAAAQKSFWVDETLSLFSDMGLLYKVEAEGRVYPYSNSAASVIDVLRKALERANVKVVYGFEAERIARKNGGFLIYAKNKESVYADRVIVTTGGKACPSSGSDGAGYGLLSDFGHSVTRLFPSLVQLKLKGDRLKALNGIKIDARVSVREGKTVLRSECGEVLFTSYGVSGPAVFALSRFGAEKAGRVLEVDMMPEYDFSQLCDLLYAARARMNTAEELFVGILPKRIAQVLIKEATGIKLNSDIKALPDADIKKIAQKTKSFCSETDGSLAWANAQVTAGGVRTAEFNPETMQSLLREGLFAAGELLDIDGDCGGYNLQWAWSSGYIAGKSAAGGGKC